MPKIIFLRQSRFVARRAVQKRVDHGRLRDDLVAPMQHRQLVERARNGAIATDRLPRFEPGRQRDALVRVRNLAAREIVADVLRAAASVEVTEDDGRRLRPYFGATSRVWINHLPFTRTSMSTLRPTAATRGGWSWPLDANIVDQYAS